MRLRVHLMLSASAWAVNLVHWVSRRILLLIEIHCFLAFIVVVVVAIVYMHVKFIYKRVSQRLATHVLDFVVARKQLKAVQYFGNAWIRKLSFKWVYLEALLTHRQERVVASSSGALNFKCVCIPVCKNVMQSGYVILSRIWWVNSQEVRKPGTKMANNTLDG